MSLLDPLIPMLDAPSRHRMPAALVRAAAAVARLDQVESGHPLCGAFLYRSRLEAVRQHAAVDGHGIDPWHLAAIIEGLRPRIDQSLGLYDRGSLIDAARYAFDEYQWLVAPTFAQDDAILKAGITFPAMPEDTPLLAGHRPYTLGSKQGAPGTQDGLHCCASGASRRSSACRCR